MVVTPDISAAITLLLVPLHLSANSFLKLLTLSVGILNHVYDPPLLLFLSLLFLPNHFSIPEFKLILPFLPLPYLFTLLICLMMPLFLLITLLLPFLFYLLLLHLRHHLLLSPQP
jgi:hypothetical protein